MTKKYCLDKGDALRAIKHLLSIEEDLSERDYERLQQMRHCVGLLTKGELNSLTGMLLRYTDGKLCR